MHKSVMLPVDEVRAGHIIVHSGVAAHVLYLYREYDHTVFQTSVGSTVRVPTNSQIETWKWESKYARYTD